MDNKSILITGGTGTFGKAFVRTVLKRFNVRKIIIFSRDELKQYDMANEFGEEERHRLRFFLGDVRDRDRLEMAMRGVDYVVHAAALKQVPASEYNPFECIKTNVHGAENVVQAALRTGIRRVVALSTDKAANPINLYGASKLASDKIFVAANNLSGEVGTRFSVVRYGNVIGSRGSVVPLFLRLIREGVKKLPVTDPRMTRFWIAQQQGVDFALSALGMMTGGEIFVPKIPSMKIIDLAHALAPDLGCETVGIRPGEKLHEIMITADDARTTLELDDRYVIEPAFAFWTNEIYVANGARPVRDGFMYSSDSNTEWLDADSLKSILQECHIVL